MAIDTASPRTRRALLSAVLGAGVATVASALGRPPSVRAGTDGDVVLGATNSSATKTRIETTNGFLSVFEVASLGEGDAISGLAADRGIGVLGTSKDGRGVVGLSETDIGVHGGSQGSIGVLGASNGVGISGIFGRTNSGVFGLSNSGSGIGVHGKAMSGRGVYGEASTGHAVDGFAVNGTAGHFATPLDSGGDVHTGYAIRAVGRVRFDKCTGVATIAEGTRSVVVTPGIDVIGSAAVVATLQGNPGGTTTVQRVAVSPTTNTFTIYLTANSTKNVRVAWHVFG